MELTSLEHHKKSALTYNGRSVVTTLAPSFLNGSSSFVGNKDFHKSLNELIFRHTHPPATELAALEHLKYNYIML